MIINPIITSTSIKDGIYQNSSEKKWTLMIYGDMDYFHSLPNIGRFDYLYHTKVHSLDNVDVIVLRDDVYGPGKIWYMKENGGRRLLKRLDEVNMGSYDTLKFFIEYVKENFPADRYILDMYNHGSGWVGACWDETNGMDCLSMDEMYRALNETGGVDIITFFTPCNMAAVESFYELRDVVDVYVAREVGTGYTKHVLNPLCEFLNNENQVSNIEVGRKIIDIFIDGRDKYPLSSLDMSAMRTDMIDSLVWGINNLSIFLIDNIDVYHNTITEAHRQSQSFPLADRVEHTWEKIDIYDFCDKLLDFADYNETLYCYIEQVKNGINNTVINHYNDESYPGIHGLHVFFPTLYYKGQPEIGFNYLESNLDFIDDSYWDEFLDTYHSKYILVDCNGSEEYIRIQDAIDNSSDNDIIYVKSGIYNENIMINKSVSIVGEDYNSTIIKGNGKNDVVCINSENVTLHFFTVINSGLDHAGIKINSNFTDISNCQIVDNYYGVYVNNSNQNRIYCCIIEENDYGVYLENCLNTSVEFNILNYNKKNCFFINSFYSYWENYYDGNNGSSVRLIPKIVPGYIKKAGLKIPWVNFDYLHTNSLVIVKKRIDEYIIKPIKEILNKK